MITRISLSVRKARGNAADTAARPPTLTKSSISGVTNKTRIIAGKTPTAFMRTRIAFDGFPRKEEIHANVFYPTRENQFRYQLLPSKREALPNVIWILLCAPSDC